MMKRQLIAIAAFLLLGTLSTQAQPPGMMNFQDIPVSIPSPLAVNLDFGEGTIGAIPEADVEVLKNVVYVNRDGKELHMNVFYPKAATAPLPCIVYIPGSAWMQQNLDMATSNLIRLSARGYVIACVEYRPSSVAQFPAQAQDAKTAVRFMRKNAALYHVDTDNVFAWGDSSGGHTSLLTGLTHGNAELDTDVYGEFSDRVNAIIDYFGPSELDAISKIPNMLNQNPESSPEALLIGGSIAANPERARQASPIYYINRESPPTLVAHGNRDFLVPLSQSDLVAEALEKAGVDYEYYCMIGAGHGGPQFWNDEMLDVVEKFMRRHMK